MGRDHGIDLKKRSLAGGERDQRSMDKSYGRRVGKRAYGVANQIRMRPGPKEEGRKEKGLNVGVN